MLPLLNLKSAVYFLLLKETQVLHGMTAVELLHLLGQFFILVTQFLGLVSILSLRHAVVSQVLLQISCLAAQICEFVTDGFFVAGHFM